MDKARLKQIAIDAFWLGVGLGLTAILLISFLIYISADLGDQ